MERAVAVQTCGLPGRHFATTLPGEDKRLPDDHVCPVTPESAPHMGKGTAAKPAHEPVVVARKPLAGTVAETVLAYGTGALNIDACRVGYVDEADMRNETRGVHVGGAYEHPAGSSFKREVNRVAAAHEGGRWPANVVLVHADGCRKVGERVVKGSVGTRGSRESTEGWRLHHETGQTVGYADADGMEAVEAWECVDGCPVAELDGQSGDLRARGNVTPTRRSSSFFGGDGGPDWRVEAGDSGSAARFFYTAKASRAEREAGLIGKVPCARCGGLDTTEHEIDGRKAGCIRNDHPTVKPVAVMRWLVRLVTPPGALVLDPFAGSGTTGIAAGLEGFEFVGVEQDERSAEIARARMAFWREHGEDGLRVVRERDAAEARSQARRGRSADVGQNALF